MPLKTTFIRNKTNSFKLFLFLLISPFIFKAQTVSSTTVTGNLQVDSTMSTTGNLQVTGTSNFDSSLVVNDVVKAEDLIVSGSAKVAGDVDLGGKLLFDATNSTGIGFKAGSTSGTGTFLLGRVPPIPLPLFPVPCAASPQSGLNFNIGANLQIYDQFNPTTSGILNIQTWTGGSSIDASVGSVTGNQGLLINYFCGNSTAINTGVNGGIVYVGDIFRARKNVQIGPHWQPLDPNVILDVYSAGLNDIIKIWGNGPASKLIHDNYDQFTIFGNGNSHWGVNMQIGFAANSAIQDANTSLNIFNDTRDGIKFKTVWNNTKLISINNPNFASSPFILFATGTVSFTTNSGLSNQNIITITNSSISSSKSVFEVLGDGRTHIGTDHVNSRPTSSLTVAGEVDCKSLFVLKPTTWSDYIFANEYKLNDLQVEEEYILKHKHLKGIPSEKEVLENGYDINEMNAKLLAKLEESYLHIINLQKEVNELKKKLK